MGRPSSAVVAQKRSNSGRTYRPSAGLTEIIAPARPSSRTRRNSATPPDPSSVSSRPILRRRTWSFPLGGGAERRERHALGDPAVALGGALQARRPLPKRPLDALAPQVGRLPDV